MYQHMYARTHTYPHAPHTHVHMCPHPHTHVHTHVPTHARTPTCTPTHTCTHVITPVHTHVRTHVPTHAPTCMHTHVPTHACTHLHGHGQPWCCLPCSGSTLALAHLPRLKDAAEAALQRRPSTDGRRAWAPEFPSLALRALPVGPGFWKSAVRTARTTPSLAGTVLPAEAQL